MPDKIALTDKSTGGNPARRSFLKNAAALAGGGLFLSLANRQAWASGPDAGRIGSIAGGILPAFSRSSVSAADQVNIGAIGINGMGWADLTAALKVPGVNVAALCDVDRNVLDARMKDLEKMNIDVSRVKVYGDYRKLLEQKDIDAVIIGTPDHWHALIMIEACEAGKDVYVEKPVGNSIGECQAMAAAQQRYGRVVQAGQWQRSQQHFQDAVDFIHTGQLGNIRTVKSWCYLDWARPAPVVADSAPPPGTDYTKWLGPAPLRPFNASRFHFNFRWFWDYAGGLMTDWGVHLLDYALLGMKADLPLSVAALGGRYAYPELAEETPDTMTVLYEFKGFNLIWDHALGINDGPYNRDHGIAFIGNNGTLVLNRAGWEVLEERESRQKVARPFEKSSDNGLDKHWVNFIGCVRSRKRSDLHCPIGAGAHVATVAQMGNISLRSGQRLTWDAASGRFTDPAINRQYFMKEYHNGYRLPGQGDPFAVTSKRS